MKSPPSEPYVSQEWFARLGALSHVPDDADFVVEHRIARSGGEQFAHQQLFDGERLVGWVPGRPVAAADLVLVRTGECDAGDLLGRLPAVDVVQGTSIYVDARQTDLFGVSPITRPGLDAHAVGAIDVQVVAFGTPFGDLEVVMRLESNGSQQLVLSGEADTQMTIRASWSDLIDWMHTDVLFGYLINSEQVQFDGSYPVLSYVEGHISWPRTPQDRLWSARFVDVMRAYERYRLSSEYLAFMDHIEEFTQ